MLDPGEVAFINLFSADCVRACRSWTCSSRRSSRTCRWSSATSTMTSRSRGGHIWRRWSGTASRCCTGCRRSASSRHSTTRRDMKHWRKWASRCLMSSISYWCTTKVLPCRTFTQNFILDLPTLSQSRGHPFNFPDARESFHCCQEIDYDANSGILTARVLC